MTPLMILIALGKKDDCLLDVIADLERFARVGRLSEREQETLNLAYFRLDLVTQPWGN